jgi:hypothetical protein
MNIKQAINTTNGKFFSIVYKNKKGETNTYTVRTGVKKGTKGGTNHCPPNAQTLYVIAKNGKVNPHFGTFYLDKIALKLPQSQDIFWVESV